MKEKEITKTDILANLALIEYQGTFQRKNTLEHKSSSYVTVLSILLATATAIYISQFNKVQNQLSGFLYTISYIAEIYFSIFSMVCHLLSQKATKLTHFNLKNIDPIWKNEDDEKIGSVYKSAKKYIKYNNEKIEKIEFYMKLVYNFSWLSLISFIVFIIISIKFIAF